MNCSDVSRFAPMFLAGELDSARKEEFSAHLRQCTACGQELERQSALDQLLRQRLLAEPVDSAAVAERVRERIRLGQDWPEERRRVPLRRVFALSGIAAMLLLGVVSYRAKFAPRPRPFDAAAARDHRVEVVEGQPRKWRTDRASIETLAARQGLSWSVLASLAPPEYHLAQGRYCFLNGRVFLHLVYADDAGNFSLFLRAGDAPNGGESIRTDAFAAEHVASFERGRVSALIVTEQSEDAVRRLAKLAEAAL